MTPVTAAFFAILLIFRTEIGTKLVAAFFASWLVALILVMIISGLPLEKLLDRPWTVENERWAMARWSLLAWEIILLGGAWCIKEYRERT